MTRKPLELFAVLALASGSLLVAKGSPAADAPLVVTRAVSPALQEAVSYSEDVVPIFQESCLGCHGGENEDGEVIVEAFLDLTTYEGLMAGSEYGLVVEPGDPENSILVDVLESGEMPDEGDPLSPEQIETIRTWVGQGAENN